MARYADQIYELVSMIPSGSLATYGQVAGYIPGCTARMVGHALSVLERDTDIPWHRVINAAGTVSPRPGSDRQYQCLADEGHPNCGTLDLRRRRWTGPDAEWLDRHGQLL